MDFLLHNLTTPDSWLFFYKKRQPHFERRLEKSMFSQFPWKIPIKKISNCYFFGFEMFNRLLWHIIFNIFIGWTIFFIRNTFWKYLNYLHISALRWEVQSDQCIEIFLFTEEMLSYTWKWKLKVVKSKKKLDLINSLIFKIEFPLP